MANYRWSMGERVSRKGGGSAVRCAAYLARESYYDRRTHETHDYRVRERSDIAEVAEHDAHRGRHNAEQEALFVGLYGPAGAPAWTRGKENIAEFWNRLEAFEKHPHAQIAERVIISLPHELTVEQNRWALQDHIREFTRQGRVVQVAIHSPDRQGDQRNIHAHLLISTRGVDEQGFKPFKAREQQDRFMRKREYVEGLRENWAHVANRHLARHGFEASLDHRSLQRQGIDREPTLYLGPKATWRERQGLETDLGRANREIQARNAERERQGLDRVHELRHEQAQGLGDDDDFGQRPRLRSGYRAADQQHRKAAEIEQPAQAQRPEPTAEIDPARIDRELKLDRLRGLSLGELQTEAKVNLSKEFWHRDRVMTVEEVARAMNPAIEEGHDRAQKLRTEAGETDRVYRRHDIDRHHAEQAWHQRHETMGRVRRWAWSKGLLHDEQLYNLSATYRQEDGKAKAAERLAAEQRAEAERLDLAADRALKAALPAAEIRLAELNERAELAQQVINERQAPYRSMTDRQIEQVLGRRYEELEQIERRLSPDYAKAADHVAHLGEQRQSLVKSLEDAQYAADRANRQIEQRWQEMGRGLGLRQWGHYLGGEKLGLAGFRDAEIDRQGDAWQAAQERITALNKEVEGIDQAMPAARKKMEQEHERIRPEAERVREQQQDAGCLAYGVRLERERVERTRQRQIEMEQERLHPRRSLGWER